MLYALLCYDSEAVVTSWTREQDQAAVDRLDAVTRRLEAQGRLGPVLRLLPTTTATTVRKGQETLVLDGPFAETKEQLLGLFLVECDTLQEAIEAATELGRASSSLGAYEIRPLALYRPGSLQR